MMKRKIKHLEKDKNTEQTVVWLTQTIDTELARGEKADEQLILECAEYLQELSPEAASLTAATEKHLQAELKTATSPAARRRVTRTLQYYLQIYLHRDNQVQLVVILYHKIHIF